jgi:hypothetical protein
MFWTDDQYLRWRSTSPDGRSRTALVPEHIKYSSRYAWMIDVCGTHGQMAQIASGLGFDGMGYARKNPTGKSMFWSVSPDGSKMLTLSPGHYSEAGSIFPKKTAIDAPTATATRTGVCLEGCTYPGRRAGANPGRR